VVRRRLGVVFLCLLLTPAAALAVSLLQEKEYIAKASLLFRDPQFDQKLFGSTFVEESNDPAREAATNVELVSFEEVADRTARRLGRGLSGEDVSDATEVEAEGQSDIVSISATARDPKFAASLANTFGEEYVDFRREADRSTIREAQQLVRRDLRGLSAKERRSGPGESLAGRLSQLGVLASLQTGNAELAERARPPDDPASPQPLRNAALGLVLGALLGLGLALLVDRLDRRLRDPKEVETRSSGRCSQVCPKAALSKMPTHSCAACPRASARRSACSGPISATSTSAAPFARCSSPRRARATGRAPSRGASRSPPPAPSHVTLTEREPSRYLDVSRARERIGFDAAVGLEEGLERTVESFRAETLPAPASI
jgi:capsular polysaccharide biosynthesis protein